MRESEGPGKLCYDCGGFALTKLFLSLKFPRQKNDFSP